MVYHHLLTRTFQICRFFSLLFGESGLLHLAWQKVEAYTLFVFSIGSREQNGVSLLTPVSDSVFIALSDGTFLFALHGSFKNNQHQAL